MSLPYERATSGQKALEDLQKILRRFGCTKFGSMVDTELGEVMIQFEYRGRQVQVKANAKGYAAAMLKTGSKTESRKRRALAQGQIAVYSILRDWVKGQVMAIETGILTFEGAFLGQILLPTGKTVLEKVEADKLLPASLPPDSKVHRLESK